MSSVIEKETVIDDRLAENQHVEGDGVKVLPALNDEETSEGKTSSPDSFKDPNSLDLKTDGEKLKPVLQTPVAIVVEQITPKSILRTYCSSVTPKSENPNLSESMINRRISFGSDAVLCYTPTKPKKSVKRKSTTKVILTEAVRKSPRINSSQPDSQSLNSTILQDDSAKVAVGVNEIIRKNEDSILGQYCILSEEKTDQTSHQLQPNSEETESEDGLFEATTKPSTSDTIPEQRPQLRIPLVDGYRSLLETEWWAYHPEVSVRRSSTEIKIEEEEEGEPTQSIEVTASSDDIINRKRSRSPQDDDGGMAILEVSKEEESSSLAKKRRQIEQPIDTDGAEVQNSIEEEATKCLEQQCDELGSTES